MTSSPAFDPPTIDDVQSAAERLAGVAVRTPLLESPLLNELLGGRVLVKAEALQRTGSFKFRGAYNRISRLSDDERVNGVVSFSSGNHAQGVAAASKLCGTKALIVMPDDAPKVKVANTKAWGAEVTLHDPATTAREEVAQAAADERGALIVPPFDHPLIMAGQGSVGLELAAQAADAGAMLDAVLVPCGGGGLISGCATGARRRKRRASRSTRSSPKATTTRRVRSPPAAGSARRPTPPTFCDALRVQTPGELTFTVNRRLLAGGVVVSR